ncbi:MAG: hypothetical protein GF416_02160 [Candidatus Altiarchaeales archaeon]|nr:hypothetical protein [Candidatus Altiarchaeales archaeon]MBD3415922.1 hypothetical protein [Candidatus Altiarchaeales archaeon]
MGKTGTAQAKREASSPDTVTVPTPLEVQREKLEIILVSHPFRGTNYFGTYDDQGHFVGVSGQQYSQKTAEGQLKLEADNGRRILQDLLAKSKDGSTVLVLSGLTATEEDFRMMAERPGKLRFIDLDDLFRASPEDVNEDREDYNRRSDEARWHGFQGRYHDLWLIHHALGAFGPERVIFQEGRIRADDFHERISSLAEGKEVKGIAMGSFRSEALKRDRDAVIDALNLTPKDVEIPRITAIETPLFKGVPRKRVMDVERLFTAPRIKTFLANPEYMENMFGEYRIDRIEGEIIADQSSANPYNADHRMSMMNWIVGSLTGGHEYEPGRDLRWNASDDEIKDFRLRLASVLSGGKVDDDAGLEAFARAYSKKYSDIHSDIYGPGP